MIEKGTLDAIDIAEELTTDSVRNLRLKPNRDDLSLGDKISMRNRQVHFADTDDEQVEHDHKLITEEQMYYSRQIASRFDSETGISLR